MKLNLLIFLILSFTTCFCKAQIIGRYDMKSNMINSYLVLNPDSTFKFFWHFDLQSDLGYGKFRVNNDSLFLTYFQFDIIKTNNNNTKIVLSDNVDTLNGYRRDSLFYENDKLYEIKNGKTLRTTGKWITEYKPSKEDRKYYHRKYILWGPYVFKSKKTFYMLKVS